MKLLTIDDAAALVPDGAVLGVGGVMDQMVPVDFLLELASRGTRGLHCVTVAAGLSVDLLVGAGVADECSCAIVSFEDMGTSKVFRRRVESGELTFHEYTELTMITRLNAALSGLPFMPTRGALGTDIAAQEPGAMKVIECPFTGAPLLACAALEPDVSVVHVHRVDEQGNAQLDGKHIWHDMVIARAARKLIVTAEEVVSTEVIRSAPENTVLPAFAVDAVVLAPRGAAPSGCRGWYDSDREAYATWLAVSDDDAQLLDLIRTWASERADARAVRA